MDFKKYSIQEGDIILCNHPLYGGSHLPDLTLLKGVFDTNHQLIGYVINRAHHAEIGGMTPGSMPPFATNLEQEGVVFAPTYIQKNGKSNWPLIRKMLQSATYPTRDVSANIFDLKAAMAALHAGELRLKEMVKNYGLKYTHLQMSRLLNQGTSAIQNISKSTMAKGLRRSKKWMMVVKSKYQLIWYIP
ncbi:MAG: hydantoinase B/oxoprolinase family protein [Saprospiraceae bacterium]|nr:hydantoinase B/oxoprolinase family protein [Saprospiraceae bacterium]